MGHHSLSMGRHSHSMGLPHVSMSHHFYHQVPSNPKKNAPHQYERHSSSTYSISPLEQQLPRDQLFDPLYFGETP